VLPAVLAERGARGPLALITAGWRHDEPRDEPLREAVGLPVVNLGLYAAFRELERDDADLTNAYARKQSELRRVKERYRLAIVPALSACRELFSRRRDVDCPWFRQSIANLQAIDRIFLTESDRLHAAFDAEVQPARHPRVVAMTHRIRERLDGCEYLLIAGGHVGVLRNRLFFFDAAAWIGSRPIIAWSAGAMVLTEQVVLFHDHTSYGVGLAEILDRGLGLLPGVVFLPHARERLALDDVANVAVLSHRFAPRLSVGLQSGATLATRPLRSTGQRDAALLLGSDGLVVPLSEAHAVAP
jgi:hypothetical protein